MNFEPEIRAVCKQAQTGDVLASYHHHPPPSRLPLNERHLEHARSALAAPAGYGIGPYPAYCLVQPHMHIVPACVPNTRLFSTGCTTDV
jgi:hypothetical protein